MKSFSDIVSVNSFASGRLISEIVSRVEKNEKYLFTAYEIADVLNYTCRKCRAVGKPDDYIPVLFENELSDYALRKNISAKGVINRCAKFV